MKWIFEIDYFAWSQVCLALVLIMAVLVTWHLVAEAKKHHCDDFDEKENP